MVRAGEGGDEIQAGFVIRGPKKCGAPNMPTVYWKPSKDFILKAIEGDVLMSWHTLIEAWRV